MRRKLYLVCPNRETRNLEIRTVICRETPKMFIVEDDMIDHERDLSSQLLPGHRWRVPKAEVEKYAYRTKRDALQGLAAAIREDIEKEAQGDMNDDLFDAAQTFLNQAQELVKRSVEVED